MSISGPFFASNAGRVVQGGINDMQRDVAKAADERVEQLHRAFFRKPRPFYWTTVHAHPRGDHWVVSDEGSVVYNHWLEGTGSRNFPKTRFKGYRSFRIATQETAKRVPALAKPAAERLCRELNGS